MSGSTFGRAFKVTTFGESHGAGLGVDITELKDGLVVRGGKLTGAEVHGYDDHRIVMALATAALVAAGTTAIDTAEAISISYPGFFNDLKRLGARVEP